MASFENKYDKKNAFSFRRVANKMSAADGGGSASKVVVTGIPEGDKVIVGDCSTAAMQRAMANALACRRDPKCKIPQDGPIEGDLSQDTTPTVLPTGDTTLTFTPEGEDEFLGAEFTLCMAPEDIPNVVVSRVAINRKEFIRGVGNFVPACRFVCNSGCSNDFELKCWATNRAPIEVTLTNLDPAATTSIVTASWHGVYNSTDDC